MLQQPNKAADFGFCPQTLSGGLKSTMHPRDPCGSHRSGPQWADCHSNEPWFKSTVMGHSDTVGQKSFECEEMVSGYRRISVPPLTALILGHTYTLFPPPHNGVAKVATPRAIPRTERGVPGESSGLWQHTQAVVLKHELQTCHLGIYDRKVSGFHCQPF